MTTKLFSHPAPRDTVRTGCRRRQRHSRRRTHLQRHRRERRRGTRRPRHGCELLRAGRLQVTNTGPTFLAQNLGVSPGSAATGFPPGLVGGETHLADAVALQAQNDLTTAFNDAAGRTPFTILPAKLGAPRFPWVYRIGAAQLTGAHPQQSGRPGCRLHLPDRLHPLTASAAASSSSTAPRPATSTAGGQLGHHRHGQPVRGQHPGPGIDHHDHRRHPPGRAMARTAAVTLDTNTINAPVCLQPTARPPSRPAHPPVHPPSRPGPHPADRHTHRTH